MKRGEELQLKEMELAKLKDDNQKRLRDIEFYKKVEARVEEAAKEHEALQEKILLAKNEQVAEINENETVKETLKHLQEEEQVARKELQLLKDKLNSMPVSVEESLKAREKHEANYELIQRLKKDLEWKRQEVLKMKKLQMSYMPQYKRVLGALLDVVKGVELDPSVSYPGPLKDVVSWLQGEESKLARLDAMETESI